MLSTSSACAGAGFRRKTSIRPKIFWNKHLDTATSANWNVTYRPWLTTFASVAGSSVSKRPIWLVEAACFVTAWPPTIHLRTRPPHDRLGKPMEGRQAEMRFEGEPEIGRLNEMGGRQTTDFPGEGNHPLLIAHMLYDRVRMHEVERTIREAPQIAGVRNGSGEEAAVGGLRLLRV